MKNIYIIGTGLIGGSLALNLKAVKPKAVIHGIDHNEAHLTEALNLGLIHKKAVVEDIEHADLVLLSIPVNATLNLLPRILDLLPPQGLVVDMGSTKASICQVEQLQSCICPT